MEASEQIIPYERPFLYPKQKRAFFNDMRYSYVEASTKAGKTHACIVWIVEKAVLDGFQGWNGWWVAPTTAQAKIAMRRIKNATPKEFFRHNDSEGWIEFINGARIWFKSAEKPDNLYGEDVYAAVLDEASRARMDSFKALRSTLTATRGTLRLIGNVDGKSNWFYMACRAIERDMARPVHERKRQNAEYHRITAWDAVEAGVLDRDEVLDAQNTLPDEDFKELYEAIAQDDENAFIPARFVEAAIARWDDYTAGRLKAHGARIIGVDPSQGKKDPCAFAIRKGSVLEKIEEHAKMDEFGCIAHTVRLAQVEKPAAIFIDGTGFGAMIGKSVKEKLGDTCLVKWFHMSEGSDYPDEYKNKRAECWGEGRKWLHDKQNPAAIPDDEGLSIEMTCIRKVDRPHGLLQLESKEELEERGFDSPNMADAWAYTFAEPVSLVMSQQMNYPQGRRQRNIA